MQLQQHLSEKEEQVLQLDRDVEALQQALQERDRIWQAELVAGQSELRQVKQELEQAKAQDVQASAPFTIAEAQADSQNDPYKEVPTLKQELKQEKEGHEKAERRVIALQQQLDAKCQRLAADLAMLQDQLDEEKTMHAATQHKLSTVQQQAKHAFDNAAALQSQLADAVQLKAGLENALELSRKDLDCQSGKVADEVKKCDLIWKKEMKRLQLSYSELTVKYEQACLQAQQEGNLKEQERDRVRDAQQQLSTLRLDLDQKQADFEAAQHELQAAQATLVQLQNASAETASAGAAELERLLQQKMEECSKLAAENGRLQDESQKLRSQIHGLSLEKQRLEAGSEAHLAEVGTASADADRTKQQLNRLKKQMMQMQEDQESQLSWRVDAEVKLALEEHKKQEASVVAKLSKELTDVQSALEVAVTRSKQWEKENSEWRDASTQKDKEISNLHTALGELTYQSEAADNLRRSLNQSKAEVDSLRLELQNAQASMHEAQSSRRAAENAADMAQKSLQKLEDKARAVREENIRLKRALEESVRKITDINQNSDSMVDRRVVVKLLVTYIERRNSRDVLALMSRMLGFTEEEQKRCGHGMGQLW
ncbi:unnamed protein product [Ostreobium quekettii]|uniref:GRIP domain-containing protein n=1 Tax=Ostreobium quekettii TaxID=121088 RepID=A0A8S1IL32_9CHLO|nr:unnamed protein product [Ostreobium quekettii]